MHRNCKEKSVETRIVTSQCIQIDQTPAGVGERIFARLLDYLLISLYAVGLTFLLQRPGLKFILNTEYDVFIIFLLASPVIFYSLLWELLNRGRSPGKMAFGLRVVMRDGATPTLSVYLLRWMMLLVDVWFSGLGIFFILVDKDNRRLGDLASGAIVIKERDYHRIHVSLDEFDYLGRGYKPFFPQAENLSLEQMNIIHEALKRDDSHRLRRISELSAKAKEFLKIAPSVDDETFLQTLTRDYQYYALEEI